MTEQPKPVRCAIYTRKSTEEGLEQEFNTLHAQRESAEAYILSHRQAGWTALTGAASRRLGCWVTRGLACVLGAAASGVTLTGGNWVTPGCVGASGAACGWPWLGAGCAG